MTKKQITTLLFDFGNVLLPLDVEGTYQAFKDLGAKPSLHNQLPLFHNWERGELDQASFIHEIRLHIPYATYKSSILNAWNAMILDFPDVHLELLKTLKKQYQLVLVSNINPIHEQFIKQQMGPFTYAKFIRQFSSIYYSHYMGLRKPEVAFFERVLRDKNISGSEAFFVVDTLANITVAQELGISCWHFNPAKDKLLDLPEKLALL
jgi:FMN phosphatase YigB (HAD superfamily)